MADDTTKNKDYEKKDEEMDEEGTLGGQSSGSGQTDDKKNSDMESEDEETV